MIGTVNMIKLFGVKDGFGETDDPVDIYDEMMDKASAEYNKYGEMNQ